MRLSDLLGQLSQEDIARLAGAHMRGEIRGSRAELCHLVEGVLRSLAGIQRILISRQPPAFALLTTLLEAEDFAVDASEIEARVSAETQGIVDRVAAGEVVARSDGLRVYRRLFAEARRNGLEIDDHEAALLSVLRRELGVRLVEHFLVELATFWNRKDALQHEVEVLGAFGILFWDGSRLALASDLVPLVQQALGVEMGRPDARRLFNQLSSAQLVPALERWELKIAGTKEERVERLLANWISPREVLEHVDLVDLRELLRALDAKISGSKSELIDRVVHHFSHDLELPKVEPPPQLPAEPKLLARERFEALFRRLASLELSELLREIDSSRLTGSKDTKLNLLWESPLSEESLLLRVPSRQLERLLAGLNLRLAGSKAERAGRLLGWASSVDLDASVVLEEPDEGPVIAEEFVTISRTVSS